MPALPARALDRLLAPYRDESLRIREKTRLLALVVLALGGFALILTAAMAATGALVVAALVSVFILFCAAVLIFLGRGRFGLASSIFLYGLFAVMFAAIKFDQYRNLYECYVFGTLGIFLIVAACLVGSSRIQALVLTALNLGAVAVLYLVDALPLDEGRVTPLAVQSLVTSGLMILLAGAFAIVVIRLQKTLVEEAERSSRNALEQFEAMSKAVTEAEEGSALVAARLAEASAALGATSRGLQGLAVGMHDGAQALSEALKTATTLNAEAVAAQERVRSSIAAYSERVLGAASSIAQMIRSVEELGKSSEERKEGVSTLASLAHAGEGKVAEVGKAIGAIVDNSSRLLEMNALIGDVADRINLLGMNASIEAAHAGASGRGFAVVAGEIRTLSLETAKGTGSIKSILTEIQAVVEGADRASRETDRFFRTMAEEIRLVSTTFSELLGRLGELGSGTAEVSQAMNAFRELASRTGSATEETTAALGLSTERFAEVSTVAECMVSDARNMASSCDELLARVRTLDEAGKENMRRIEELKRRIRSFA